MCQDFNAWSRKGADFSDKIMRQDEEIESAGVSARNGSASERVLVMLNHRSYSSWPGLSRPSTPCLLSSRKQDVDARDKRGHDDWRVVQSDRHML